MLLSVVRCEQVGPYSLNLVFSTGEIKHVDISAHWAELFGPIFQQLRDPVFFSQVCLPDDSETIEWPNGADLAAEYLYSIGKLIGQVEHLPAFAR
jgi:hypothetical protein